MSGNNVEPVVDKLEDLPEELKKQLSRAFLKGTTSMDGFIEKLQPILKNGAKNVDEIILGWYKEYNSEILKRASTTTRLNNAVKEGKLSQPSRAVFSLPEKEKKEK